MTDKFFTIANKAQSEKVEHARESLDKADNLLASIDALIGEDLLLVMADTRRILA